MKRKRVEDAALKAYPFSEGKVVTGFGSISFDQHHDAREGFIKGYEQAEKDMIKKIREQVKQWMPEKDGEENTCGKRVAFNSVLHLLEEMEEE